MTYPPLSPQLSHLSAQELQQLIEDYYSKECSVKDLLDRYAIQVSPGSLVSLFPPQPDPEVICPYCGKAMVRIWQSRTSYRGSPLSDDCFCQQCGHWKPGPATSWDMCECSHCIQKRFLQQEQVKAFKQKCIYLAYGRERSFRLHDTSPGISLKHAIYLLALERQSISGEIGIFSPVNNASIPCSPHRELTAALIQELLSTSYIKIDPASSPDAFFLTKDKLDPDIAAIQLYADLGSSLAASKQYLRALEQAFRTRNWPQHWRLQWRETIPSLWQELALYECLQYLTYLGNKEGLTMPQGDKTKAVLADTVSDYPIAQVYPLIWLAVAQTSEDYLAEPISRKHAANRVVGKLQSALEKLRLGVRQPQTYHRHKALRESALFEVLFDLVLQIGDEGFYATFPECLPALSWINAPYQNTE